MADLMLKDSELPVTHEQGQMLLNCLVGGVEMPKELDDMKFDVADQSYINDSIGEFRKVVMQNTKRHRDPKGVCFGNVDNWEITKQQACDRCGARPVWVMKDQDSVFIMKDVSEKAREGLYWVLLLLSHPRSIFKGSIGVMQDLVWPLACAIEGDKKLRADLKLDLQKGPKIQWNQDPRWSSLKKV